MTHLQLNCIVLHNVQGCQLSGLVLCVSDDTWVHKHIDAIKTTAEHRLDINKNNIIMVRCCNSYDLQTIHVLVTFESPTLASIKLRILHTIDRVFQVLSMQWTVMMRWLFFVSLSNSFWIPSYLSGYLSADPHHICMHYGFFMNDCVTYDLFQQHIQTIPFHEQSGTKSCFLILYRKQSELQLGNLRLLPSQSHLVFKDKSD